MYHNSYSSIDLAIGSASLYTYLECDVLKNPFGSDHFLITLNLNPQHVCPPNILRWKIASADWKAFNETSYLPSDFIHDFSIDDAVSYFTAFIIDKAEKHIPQTSGNICKTRVPWWNDDCRQA